MSLSFPFFTSVVYLLDRRTSEEGKETNGGGEILTKVDNEVWRVDRDRKVGESKVIESPL